MSTVVFTTTRPAGRLMARIGRGLRDMIQDHEARRARRIERREIARLGATSGHLLTDIGLTATEANGPRQQADFPTW